MTSYTRQFERRNDSNRERTYRGACEVCGSVYVFPGRTIRQAMDAARHCGCVETEDAFLCPECAEEYLDAAETAG